MINKLEGLEHFPHAMDIPISIATANTVISTNWKNCSLSWAQLVTALSEVKETGETFEEYKSADKKTRLAKKDAAGAFVGGALKGPRRQETNLADRDLLTLDLDGPDGDGMEMSLGELLDAYQKKFNNEAVFYSTHSHQATKPRIRLVLPMSRTLKPEEYEPVARMVADDLGIEEVDPASFSPVQAMFFPTAAVDGDPVFRHLPGDFLDPDEILNRYEDPQDRAEWPGKAAREAPEALPLDWDGTVAEGSQADAIGHREATEAVKEWTAREWQKLQDYGNFLSALFVIVKGVQHGEITRETGQECAVLLAGNRDEWKHDNVEKFNKELDNPDIRTDYTFRQKFMWQPGSDPVEDFEFVESDLVCYADIEPKAVEWLWDGYIPLGMLTTIQGDPGGGKTYVSTGLTAGITNGVLPPDEFGIPGKIEPRNVLFINGEDSPEHTIRPRLDQAGADPSRVFTLQIDKDPLNFSQIGRIEAAIKLKKPLLVVFDPIQQFLGAGVDMHRANEIRPVLARLKDLASKYSFACVFVMHMNKYGGGKAQYRGLGSIDISAIMRAQLLVGENRNIPGGRLVVPIKNSLGKLQAPQGFTITDMGLSWTGPDLHATEEDVLMQAKAKEGSELDNAMNWLRNLLDEKPMWSKGLDEVAEAEGISNRTLVRARQQMKDSWEICTKKAPGIKKWYWAMTKREIAFKGNQGLEYEEQRGQEDSGEQIELANLA